MVRNPLDKRVSFSRHKDIIDLPYLIEIQKDSYENFLQMNVLAEERKNTGLQAIYNEIFPISSYDDSARLEFVSYSFGVPKYDVLECQRRSLTYSAPLKVLLRLKEKESIKEEVVYMGPIPMMTPQGTFIINGAERVIVSQLHRSPGICFEQVIHPRGTPLYAFRIIPYRGSWLEGQFDINDLIYIYIDRRKRRRKILASVFLRALGYGTDEELIRCLCTCQTVSISAKTKLPDLFGKILVSELKDPKTDDILVRPAQTITKEVYKVIISSGVKKIDVLDTSYQDSPVIKMVKRDQREHIDSYDAALLDIYRKLRPGDPATLVNARSLIKRLFFDVKRYDLGRVGRYKLNRKLSMPIDEEELQITHLKKQDIIEAVKYLIGLRTTGGPTDDIDHLGSRRVRSIGELLQNQCRVGLVRLERLIKERMNLYDMSTEVMTPTKLINPKGFSSIIKDFFGRSQLSQFMDQTNPLAELTHKRRMSALGPGGLSRERAGFEVRDVHPSHYGRICPIETPEGPNIGLIASLSTYAKINEFGFLETPYQKVIKGKAIKDVVYVAADEEEKHVIAQANVPRDDKGNLQGDRISVRYKGDFLQVTPDKVEFIDVSPKQLVSVAAGLIPFLEHDDANRALMGSNMQRQAVPLQRTEAPIVATGLEYYAARDSGVMVLAEENGVVTYVDSTKIAVNNHMYYLRKYLRSNSGTCMDQKPIVKVGEKVKKGDVLADGPATQDGEMALGRNILVSFMPWGGYNFEDAILISEKLVKDDIYTSIHIDEFEIGARDTKLGREEITRDIPNVGEDALKNLGEDGIIRIGAEVKPGDILVGKITPKSQTELTPEERLLHAIFGEKAADVKDASLRVPSGASGIVMDVKVFARKEKAGDELDRADEKRQIRKLVKSYKEKMKIIKEQRDVSIEELLLGKRIKGKIFDEKTGQVLVKAGAKITRKQLEELETRDYKDVSIEEGSERSEFRRIFMEYERSCEVLNSYLNREVDKVKKGDELDPGVIKQVKVYIASKRKLSVGDKMAGRHGNKGVIAKILPEEDMPFLPDGTPVDMVLNPLGVPSRMNVGQVLETHLGWAGRMLGMNVMTPVFDGITEDEIMKLLEKASLPDGGKIDLYDGRTGEKFDQQVVVGFLYMMKLSHLVADKIHARAIGPYSLVTQQPLGGKAQFGGQRFGEMEVWALEAYGAAYALQELLTVKSDDVAGRTRIYESIVKGQNSLQSGTPESFNVLMKEIQSLALDIRPEKKAEASLQ